MQWPVAHILLMTEFCRETEPDWDLDIKEDVQEECSKYGPVKHIYVDKHSLVNIHSLLRCTIPS